MEIKSLDERIEDLIRTIEDDAHTEIEAIKVHTTQNEAEILAEGERHAKTLRESIIGKAQQDALKRKEELKAENLLSQKKVYLDQREILLHAVFDEVDKSLEKVLHTVAYRKALQEMIKEALANLETSDAIIHLDAYSRSLITTNAIKAIGDTLQMKVSIGEDLKRGFGVLATDLDVKRQYENTLQARLNRKKKFLRSDIYRFLMGEENE